MKQGNSEQEQSEQMTILNWKHLKKDNPEQEQSEKGQL